MSYQDTSQAGRSTISKSDYNLDKNNGPSVFEDVLEDSDDSMSDDMNEIKLQQAISIRKQSKKRNFISKDDYVFGIIPVDDEEQKI
jgi:hypothetical protein